MADENTLAKNVTAISNFSLSKAYDLTLISSVTNTIDAITKELASTVPADIQVTAEDNLRLLAQNTKALLCAMQAIGTGSEADVSHLNLTNLDAKKAKITQAAKALHDTTSPNMDILTYSAFAKAIDAIKELGLEAHKATTEKLSESIL